MTLEKLLIDAKNFYLYQNVINDGDYYSYDEYVYKLLMDKDKQEALTKLEKKEIRKSLAKFIKKIDNCKFFDYYSILEKPPLFIAMIYRIKSTPENCELNKLTSTINLYFNISLDKIEEFVREFTLFASENEISVHVKVKEEKTTDMINVKFKDVDKLDDIVKFITKYRELGKTNPLIDTCDGIGYTIEGAIGYNAFLNKVINKYVETAKYISKDDFIEFIKKETRYLAEPIFKAEETAEHDAPYILFQNLSNLINKKEFDLTEFKERYKKLVSVEKKYAEENRNLSSLGFERYIINTSAMKACINDNVLNPLYEQIDAGENPTKIYEQINEISNDNSTKCTVIGEDMLVTDLLKRYYHTEDVEKYLLYECQLSLGRVKCVSVVNSILLELTKLGLDNEENIPSIIDTILKENKKIEDYDMPIKEFISSYICNHSNNPHMRYDYFLNSRVHFLITIFHLLEKIIEDPQNIIDHISSFAEENFEYICSPSEKEHNHDILISLIKDKYKDDYNYDTKLIEMLFNNQSITENESQKKYSKDNKKYY